MGDKPRHDGWFERIDDAIAGCRRDGVAVVQGVLPAERIAKLCAEADRLSDLGQASELGNLRVGLREDRSGYPVPDRFDPVADISRPFAELNREPLLVEIARGALGEAVTVMKEKLIFKRPGTSGFGTHRDGSYNTPKSGVPWAEMVTISVALDPTPLESGPTEFFPDLLLQPTPAPPGEPRDVDEAALHGVDPRIPELAPGDVVVFDGRIPHRSTPNRSDRSRRVYMVTYVPARYPNARTNYYEARCKELARERDSLEISRVYFE